MSEKRIPDPPRYASAWDEGLTDAQRALILLSEAPHWEEEALKLLQAGVSHAIEQNGPGMAVVIGSVLSLIKENESTRSRRAQALHRLLGEDVPDASDD